MLQSSLLRGKRGNVEKRGCPRVKGNAKPMFMDRRFSGCRESLHCAGASGGSESGEEAWALID